jgi:hypothetical protein
LRKAKAITSTEDEDRFLKCLAPDSGHAKPHTAWGASILSEYRKAGLHKWDNEKVDEVCRLFHCTLSELAAVAGVDGTRIGKYRTANRWPMYLTIQWDRMIRFKLQLPGLHVQDAMAVKAMDFRNNEEDKAA